MRKSPKSTSPTLMNLMKPSGQSDFEDSHPPHYNIFILLTHTQVPHRYLLLQQWCHTPVLCQFWMLPIWMSLTGHGRHQEHWSQFERCMIFQQTIHLKEYVGRGDGWQCSLIIIFCHTHNQGDFTIHFEDTHLASRGQGEISWESLSWFFIQASNCLNQPSPPRSFPQTDPGKVGPRQQPLPRKALTTHNVMSSQLTKCDILLNTQQTAFTMPMGQSLKEKLTTHLPTHLPTRLSCDGDIRSSHKWDQSGTTSGSRVEASWVHTLQHITPTCEPEEGRHMYRGQGLQSNVEERHEMHMPS